MATFKKTKYAFFDLDYTVIPHDTLFLLGNFVVRKQPWRIYYLLFLIPAFGFFLTGLIGAHGLKRAFLSILAGMSRQQVEKLADQFSEALLELTFPEIISEIEQHKKSGTTLILNTASPVFYIEPLGKKLGFDRCVGSTFLIEDKMPLWIKPIGPNNKNIVKLDNMADIIPADVLESVKAGRDTKYIPGSDAYSDSTADLPLLRIAEHKHTIQPGKKLRAISVNSGWTIWEPKLPFSGILGKGLISLKQMFGCYKMG